MKRYPNRQSACDLILFVVLLATYLHWVPGIFGPKYTSTIQRFGVDIKLCFRKKSLKLPRLHLFDLKYSYKSVYDYNLK